MSEVIDLEAWASAELERLAPLINDPARNVEQRIADAADWRAACCVFGIDGNKMLEDGLGSVKFYPETYTVEFREEYASLDTLLEGEGPFLP